MTKWDYKFFNLSISFPEIEKTLEFQGKNGWELCGIDNGVFYFKKPQQKEKKQIASDKEYEIGFIIDFLNSRFNSSYTKTSSATNKFITARLNEGKTLDDFCEVINSRVDLWCNDENMKQYIRPETLFGNKFESYLQYAKSNKPKEPINPNMKGMVY